MLEVRLGKAASVRNASRQAARVRQACVDFVCPVAPSPEKKVGRVQNIKTLSVNFGSASTGARNR